MVICGNSMYEVDNEGNVVDEYKPEEGCVWEAMGMCRGCPVCSYHDNVEEEYEE